MNAATWILQHETWMRLITFGAFLVLLRIGEGLWALRGDAQPARRQMTNIALMLVYTLVLRVAFPVLAVAWATVVHDRGGGLFPWFAWSSWVEIVLSMVLLDLAIYWQHRLMHSVPIFWRIHRVHHSDTAFDVTTGVRFHPFEIVLSMGYKLALIAVLGPDPRAVVLFELVLSAASLFTHADLAFPPRVDRAIRRVLVTPSMHRIHHSVRREETDSNFGFDLTIWDRLFGSYRAESVEPQNRMAIGLDRFRAPRDQGLLALLLQPFRSNAE